MAPCNFLISDFDSTAILSFAPSVQRRSSFFLGIFSDHSWKEVAKHETSGSLLAYFYILLGDFCTVSV